MIPPKQPKEVFTTLHGSRLYGLHTDESDWDYYTVISSGENKTYIDGDLDHRVITFDTFLEQIDRGVPQALEALFSPVQVWSGREDFLKPILYRFRAGYVTYSTYRRTIKAFALHENLERRKHVVRLALNLNGLVKNRRFNPVLTAEELKLVRENPSPSLETLSEIAGIVIE